MGRARIAAGVLLVTAALGAFVPGCSGGPPTLSVDLKTDLVPGREFVGVRTELFSQRPADGVPPLQMDVSIATLGDDFVSGKRVADMTGLSDGSFFVRVTLLDGTGTDTISHLTAITIKGNTAITVLITRTCVGVTCPSDPSFPDLTQCVGGRCVDPRCEPHAPEYCGTGSCTTSDDCTASVPCARGVCVDGACFQQGTDSVCAPGQYCDLELGCTDGSTLDAGPPDAGPPDAGPPDAGPSCTPTTEDCTNGVDDDCDGLIDCADPDCGASSCDDGNPCTDDACDGASGACTHTNNTASCDDGNACTTGDVCAGGTCAGAGTLSCNDGNPCTDDGCDPASGCTHTNNTASCNDGNACTTGDTCSGGSCRGTGTRSCNDSNACTNDSCNPSSGCHHTNKSNGTSCGSGGHMCCGGHCRATHTDTNNCGACGIVCASGESCQSTGGSYPGTGHYQCRCYANSQCRSPYGGAGSTATCWIPSGYPGFCDCQSNGDCRSGQTCAIISGHNYCHY